MNLAAHPPSASRRSTRHRCSKGQNRAFLRSLEISRVIQNDVENDVHLLIMNRIDQVAELSVGNGRVRNRCGWIGAESRFSRLGCIFSGDIKSPGNPAQRQARIAQDKRDTRTISQCAAKEISTHLRT